MPDFKNLYYVSDLYSINGEVNNVDTVIFDGIEYNRITSQTTTINLTYDETSGSYELSGGDENITISTDKKSYIYNGTNYTPTFTYTYKLHSFSVPSGPTVVTNQPGSELTGTPDATTNYILCASRNYYSSSSSYTSESKSVSCNNSTGSVSGDTAFFSYAVTSTSTTVNHYSWDQVSFKSPYTSSDKQFHGNLSQYGNDANTATGTYQDGYKAYVYLNASTGVVSGETAAVTDYGNIYNDPTTSTVYSFSSVSPKSSVSSGGHYWELYSGSGSSATFRYSTTTYDPDLYVTITWNASTGLLGYSWSGSGSSTYKTGVQNYTSHVNYYPLSTLTWNTPASVNVDSSSNNHLTITYTP